MAGQQPEVQEHLFTCATILVYLMRASLLIRFKLQAEMSNQHGLGYSYTSVMTLNGKQRPKVGF